MIHQIARYRRRFPANIYLFKVNNINTRKKWERCSKLTVKISERRQWRCSDVLLLTLNIFHTFSTASAVNFEQVNVSWVPSLQRFLLYKLFMIKISNTSVCSFWTAGLLLLLNYKVMKIMLFKTVLGFLWHLFENCWNLNGFFYLQRWD